VVSATPDPGATAAWSGRADAGASNTSELWSNADEDDMAKRSTKKTARKPNAAFMKPMSPSPALAEVIGSKAMPRTEVTKKLWAYIKKNKLQDAKNKRMIKADDALKPVFGGKSSVNMFEMTRLVNKHLS
jgi:upstream activation factor subunit UAF30